MFYLLVFQMLKERLCFDPEFWNLLTLRTHCLELISDKVMKAAVLNEMKEEEEKDYHDELSTRNSVNDLHNQGLNSCKRTEVALEDLHIPDKKSLDVGTEKYVAPSDNALPKKRKWGRRLRRRNPSVCDEEVDVADDPEFKYNLKSSTSLGNKPMYSLRRNQTTKENVTPAKLPLNRKREYLSRCVKSQILKRKDRKKRWLQGLPRLEQVQTVKEQKVKVKGKRLGRKPLQKYEVSYPENEISLIQEDTEDTDEWEMPLLQNELEQDRLQKENPPEQMNDLEKLADLICVDNISAQIKEEYQTESATKLLETGAVEADPELDGPPLKLIDCPIELLHSYCFKTRESDGDQQDPCESSTLGELNGDTVEQPQPTMEAEDTNTEVSYVLLSSQAFSLSI